MADSWRSNALGYRGQHTGAVFGDTSKGTGSHVLNEGEVGRERLIATWKNAVSAGPAWFAMLFDKCVTTYS